MLELRRARI